jgi:hypothetical protein
MLLQENKTYSEHQSDETYFIVKLQSNITDDVLNRCTVHIFNNVTHVYMDENDVIVQIVIYKDTMDTMDNDVFYKDAAKKLLLHLRQQQ